MEVTHLEEKERTRTLIQMRNGKRKKGTKNRWEEENVSTEEG